MNSETKTIQDSKLELGLQDSKQIIGVVRESNGSDYKYKFTYSSTAETLGNHWGFTHSNDRWTCYDNSDNAIPHNLKVDDYVRFFTAGDGASEFSALTSYQVATVPTPSTITLKVPGGSAVDGTSDYAIPASTGTWTLDADSDTWTCSAQHNFNNGDAIEFLSIGTGANNVADGVSTQIFFSKTPSYVGNGDTTTLQLSSTIGGQALAVTNDSVGTWDLRKARWKLQKFDTVPFSVGDKVYFQGGDSSTWLGRDGGSTLQNTCNVSNVAIDNFTIDYISGENITKTTSPNHTNLVAS